ncbi:hypothetical protein QFZ75_008072 [Streptomyces sp. V3I8]|uniref:hypothetical protein n=1 Tax=Streptomyces sp. V3I8 TaxID=3042279 RepID=UPI0027871FE0|nr:hypothetical protein [Streptomyces sp. V3I8]MDQ1041570.1 hypothetical protein [Streptomyces sp. V3I8]
MSWTLIVTTTLGAVIAVLSNLVADHARWQREEQTRHQEVKRQLYAEYLSALSRTDNVLRDTAWCHDMPEQERARMAKETFRSSGCYELRYQLGLTAPESVTRASTAAFHELRDFRDAIERGTIFAEGAYQQRRDQWYAVFPALRDSMRQDLTHG